MSWWDLAVASAVVIAVVLVPGVILALLLGLRGLWLWGLSGPFGLTAVSLAALVAPVLGWKWGIGPVAVATAVIGVGVLIARVLTKTPRMPREFSTTRGTVIAVLVGAGIVLAAQILAAIGSPSSISQTFDNVFHLNAIQFVLDTGNASPLFLGSMVSDTGGVWFYPSAWHAVAGLGAELSGTAVPLQAHAITLLLATVMWPAGVLLLTRTLFGAGRATLIGAAIAAAGMPAFPLLMVNFGVLYPFALGISAIPAVLAATVRALGLTGSSVPHRWVWIVAVVGGLPGITIAHPGAFMGWLVFASLAVVVAFVAYLRSRPRARSVVVACIGLAVYTSVALVAWQVLKPPAEARTWPTTLTIAQATGEVATLGLFGGSIPYVIAGLMLCGIVACFLARRRQHVWILLAFAAIGLLYVASASFPWQYRDILTASWYNNAPRLAALVPVIAVPLAGLGAALVWRYIARLVGKAGVRPGAALAAVAGVTIVLLLVSSQVGAVRRAVADTAEVYRTAPNAPLVSADEMALLERLPEIVPPGVTVAGSAWTGAGLAYGISDRPVLMRHTQVDMDADTALINRELVYAQHGDAVCAAIERKNVGFVLDFGEREVHDGHHPLPGLEGLASSPAVALVDQEGDAKLYRVVACTPDDQG